MTYFTIHRETEPKIVGVTDGTGQLNGSELYTESNGWYREVFQAGFKGNNRSWWEKWVHHKDFAKRPIDGIVLEKKGKLTDYMEFNLRGFYVSDKLKKILEEACIPPHVFHPTAITSKKTGQSINGYYWFAFDMDTGAQTVNFKKSEFALEAFGTEYQGSFSISSYEDYMNVFYKTGKAPQPKILFFNTTFNSELDVFGTQFLSPRTYISERLLKKWQEAGITGYIARSPEQVKERAKWLNDTYIELVFE
ncbi:hypothetical protein ACFQZS_12270 [Mucilaginibacter calamicampi]|uniref:Uncharacterized protein n=1 Tax=Mucilaginibacter calamicampi TaxID=1302352 RepID=A0ABW2YXS4_9SPHI